MLKILIVDDEEIIRKGLMLSLKKHQEFEIVGEVADGQAAIEIISETKPDVVITDIKMPGIDGKALVKYLNSNFPEIRKVVLSGYDSYDFIRETMVHGASDYLLKPVDDDYLYKLLMEIDGKILEERKAAADKLQMEGRLNESLPLLKYQVISEVLDANTIDEEIMRKRLFACGVKINRTPFRIVIISINNLKSIANNEGTDEARAKVDIMQSIVERSIPSQAVIFSCMKQQDMVVALYSEKKDEIEKICRNIHSNLSGKLKANFTIAAGSDADTLNGLRDSYRNAVNVLSQRFLTTRHSVLYYNSNQKAAVVDYEQLHAAFDMVETRLKSDIEVVKSEDVPVIFRDLLAMLEKLKPSAEDVVQMLLNLYVKLKTNFMDFEKAVLDLYGFDYSYTKMIGLFDTMEEMLKYSARTYHAVIKEISFIRNKKDKRIVEIVKEYIAKHYNEDITLAKISELVFVNPNYFCELFKTKTGENFIDYLTKVRIEKAKVLLKDVKIKTYEVSVMVGYDDPNYFSKVFKRVVGITPTQYRDQIY